MKKNYAPPTKDIPKFILNRRYKKLQELIEKEEYFSEEQIRIRDPLLYFTYVGQYIRNENQKPDLDISLSNILIEQIQRQEYELKLQQQYDNLKINHDYPGKIKHKIKDLNKETRIKNQDLEDQEDILIRLMHDKFMQGLDENFIDYYEIDQNEFYDDLKQQNQDLEEQFFDQDELQINEETKQSEYTGIQDY